MQAGLFLAVDYNIEDSVGFQTIQIEADATMLANLDLTLASDGTQDSSYISPLAIDRLLFDMPFLVAGISFTATIEANLSALLTVKGAGRMSITAGTLSVGTTHLQLAVAMPAYLGSESELWSPPYAWICCTCMSIS